MNKELNFEQKTTLIKDLQATYMIWDRDHGLKEAMFIATGGGERFDLVTHAISYSSEALGHDVGVRQTIQHAIKLIKESK